MHGDLTAWNLRRAGGDLWLVDWEDAGFGPPGADDAYFRATRALVRNTDPGTASGEVVEFWRARVAARSSTDADAATNRALLDLLAGMARPGR
jgi:thiamine kinase-like enzyme